MMKLKRIAIVFLVAAFLCLCCPSPAFAQPVSISDEAGALIVIVGLLALAGLIWLIVSIAKHSHNKSGDMFFTISRADLISLDEYGILDQWNTDGPVNLNVQYMFTDKTEGDMWASGGVTLNSNDLLGEYNLKDLAYGGNFELGYLGKAWDVNVQVFVLSKDNSSASLMVNFVY